MIEQGANNQLYGPLDARWLITTRVALLGAALVTTTLSLVFSETITYQQVAFLFGPIAFLFAFSLVSTIWMKRWGASDTFNAVQIGVDTSIITSVVYTTGGPISPFLFLYLPLVMLVALVFSRRAALFTAGFSAFAYAALTASMVSGVLPPADGSTTVQIPGSGLFLQLMGLASGMVLIAIATSYLATRLRSSSLLVEQSRRDLDELSAKHRSIEEQLEAQDRMARLLSDTENHAPINSPSYSEFVGESPIMKKVYALIERVAATEATVLISGESGTGKELVARAIHAGSGSAHKPFVAVNCGAIPENLIESELFGHKKGSFTGADADHLGLFRQAEGGTIFLDEIGELPLQMQAKLLRALQEKRVRPVGSTADIPINLRVISATNKNLKEEVRQNRFREDLFYRLNVIAISLPPLRERREDIPLLINTILRKICKSGSNPVLPPATVQALMNYSYPGNVRELENILERATVLGGQAILPEHLGDAGRAHTPIRSFSNETVIIEDESISFPVNLDDILLSIERRYLQVALDKTGGVKKQAASLLGINFRSFRYRLQKFEMGGEEQGREE